MEKKYTPPCERSILKYGFIVELFEKMRNSPPPPLRRLILATRFGVLATQFGVSPRVRVAKSRRRAGEGGLAWVALWWAFPQTQELVFWLFLLSFLTSGPFSCWYFLLLKQRFFWYYSSRKVMATLCCVAQKAASAAQVWNLSLYNLLFETYQLINLLCRGSCFLGYTAENSHHLTAKIISKDALF
jgi:hypothetical protein